MNEHHPEMGEEVANQSVLDNGTKVGELARLYFGECELVSFNVNKNEMVNKTRTLMEFVDNIAEASFLVDSLFCAVDILHLNSLALHWEGTEAESMSVFIQSHGRSLSPN